MELKISELSDSLLDVGTEKINVVKTEPINIKPILKYKNSVLQNENQNQKQAKRVSYDDILAKMGMYVDNGKLHLSEKNSCRPLSSSSSSTCGTSSSTCKVKCSRLQQHLAQPQPVAVASAPVQNSYIYNKYFKDQVKPVEQVLVPKTPELKIPFFHSIFCVVTP